MLPQHLLPPAEDWARQAQPLPHPLYDLDPAASGFPQSTACTPQLVSALFLIEISAYAIARAPCVATHAIATTSCNRRIHHEHAKSQSLADGYRAQQDFAIPSLAIGSTLTQNSLPHHHLAPDSGG